MRSLFRIIRRYSFTAGAIICVILLSNMIAFFALGYQKMQVSRRQDFRRSTLEAISDALFWENGEWKLGDKGIQELNDSDLQWCMGLDNNGQVVWEWRLPAHFDRSYSNAEVAKFSRWYLNDYPVAVWDTGKLLLVVGLDPDFFARYSEIFPLNDIAVIPQYLKIIFLVNAVVILFFVFLLGYRFYLALKPLGTGVEKLSRQEPVRMKEKGMTRDLALQINHTSEILQEQKQRLNKRDQARTEWISGISHDIRTPLALIVGYTDRLAKSSNLTEEEKRITDTICRQSQLISQLVSDLNLTSKLAYDAQPLHLEKCSPALLLRECTADLYNEELESENGQTEVELDISPEMEKAVVFADGNLVKRALRNLIGNSVRHNPQGCQIRIRLYEKDGMACFCITDSGTGIPQVVVENMDTQTEKIHIMGLRLARQIARAHGGNMEFLRRETGTYDVGIHFPAE